MIFFILLFWQRSVEPAQEYNIQNSKFSPQTRNFFAGYGTTMKNIWIPHLSPNHTWLKRAKNDYTVALDCYGPPKMLILVFIKFRENQE